MYSYPLHMAIMRRLAKLFRAPPLRAVTPLSMAQLTDKYRDRDRAWNWIGFLSFVGSAVVLYFAIQFLSDWHVREFRDAPYFMGPVTFLWALAGVFLSLFGSMYGVLLALRLWLGAEEYAIYLAYGCQKMAEQSNLAPLRVDQFFKASFYFIALPLASVVALEIDHYTAFTQTGVVENPFFSIGRRLEHSYDDIAGLYEVRSFHARFEDKVRPYQLIEFRDGTEWYSYQGAGGARLQKQRDAIAYASQKSGVPVERVEFYEDILDPR